MILRAPRPDEAAAVAELIDAFDTALGGEPETTAAEVAGWWADLDLEREAWVAEEDGRIVGYASLERRPEGPRLDGYVHPEAFGRGIGNALLEEGERRARELGAARVDTYVLGGDERARALVEGRGYRYVRSGYRMRIDLPAALAGSALPDGLVIGPAEPGEERVVHAVVNETFVDENDFVEHPFEEWWARKQREGFDHGLCFAARAGGDVVGVAQCSIRHGGGFVHALGVRREWRRQGVGQALLGAAFREFERRGQPFVGLGVDADNPTGAGRLYERVGMQQVFRGDLWEKELAAA